MDEEKTYRQNAHAVIIGINKYQDPKIQDLRYACADAEGVYKVLTDPALGRFSPGIAMEEIQKYFGRIESRQVIFFIDSCYSGEAGGRTFQNPHYQTRATLTDEILEGLAGKGRFIRDFARVVKVF